MKNETKQTPLKQLINHYLNQFEIVKIQDTDQTRVIYKDLGKNTDEELKDAIGKAHGKMPCDFIFDTFYSLLDTYLQYNDLEYIRDNDHEIIDSLVDCYTYDLTKWLNSDVNNVYYLTEVLEEMEIKDGFQLLTMAQFTAIKDVFNCVIELLENNINKFNN